MENVKPALSAKEWADLQGDRADWAAQTLSWAESEVQTVVSSRHGLAALCLYDQPFGFTQKDVRMLRILAQSRVNIVTSASPLYDSLADRIEALLPPAP